MKKQENEKKSIKSTGIIRKLDELGRIVIPMSIRQTLDIQERDPVEIYVEGERIILQKQRSGCIFCGSTKELTTFADKNVCAACRDALGRQEQA